MVYHILHKSTLVNYIICNIIFDIRCYMVNTQQILYNIIDNMLYHRLRLYVLYNILYVKSHIAFALPYYIICVN